MPQKSECAKRLEQVLEQTERVTRIQIDTGSRWRWALFDGEEEIFAATGSPRETMAMLRSTGMIVDAMAGVSPAPQLTTEPSFN